MSQNVILEERTGSDPKNNKIYLFLHQFGVMKYGSDKKDNIMQEIT